MRKFDFKLQRVRDIRAAQERIKQNELALERKKELELLLKIDRLRNDQSEEYRRGQVFLTQSLADIRMFVSHQRYMEALERTIARTCANLDSQRQAVEAARLNLIEATRKRKLLDKLREKRLGAFKKEEEVAVQKIIDEIGGTKSARLSAAGLESGMDVGHSAAKIHGSDRRP